MTLAKEEASAERVRESMRDAASPDGPDPRAQRCVVCGATEAKAKPAKTGREKLMQCGRCKTPRYCSPACQRAHWKAGHKGVCKTLAAQRDAEVARRQALAEEQEALLEVWASTMPARLTSPGQSARQTMARMQFDSDFFDGLDAEVGDWGTVMRHVRAQSSTVRVDHGDRGLEPGDRVRIRAGNGVKPRLVGKLGVLIEPLPGGRWGLELVGKRGGHSIKADNLEVVPP